ncbi:hypothetical protein [Ralstonia mannitolilytica]|uniref:hypothetical protein n=1 Tax=Ralstonia mannitolilytica TaxID=105219 RepID=UPI0011AF1740|nr:hypothetical protein [Ralstonia mannitolilytica]
MRKFQIAVLAMSMVGATSGAFAETGRLKICRHPGFIEELDRKNVLVPAGSSFTTPGPTVDFVITTTQEAKLGPKPSCATTTATVSENFGTPAKVARGRKLVPQFAIGGASLEATVMDDFR